MKLPNISEMTLREKIGQTFIMRVFEYKFLDDYNKGLTPNPCILCNREVKINFLHKAMIDFKCDYMATGHYAKIVDGKLYKSFDSNKDQTYFLAQLTKEQLSKLILPLEGITKDDVRKIAHENNLNVGLIPNKSKEKFKFFS